MTQKLQLAERGNEIYRQQLQYMRSHLASLRALDVDKLNIIHNLILRYDLRQDPQSDQTQGILQQKANDHFKQKFKNHVVFGFIRENIEKKDVPDKVGIACSSFYDGFEIQTSELRQKIEALTQRTILENLELKDMINKMRAEMDAKGIKYKC